MRIDLDYVAHMGILSLVSSSERRPALLLNGPRIYWKTIYCDKNQENKF